MFRAIVTVLCVCFFAAPAKAQETFWVQIEARQTLSEATERASVYARRLNDVQGYYLGSGFYGIVLGPYSERLARAELSRLLSSRQIPSDSYLQNGRRFEQQFWPIGGGASAAPRAQEQVAQEPVVVQQFELTAPEETPREARASEAALSREDREELQKALRWAGFYNAAIDGSFGRGTRRSMEDWQVVNLQQPTGVLTARQRELLLKQYNAVLSDMDMQLVRDDAAGIQMQMPTAAVAFSDYQPPFAKYAGQGPLPEAQVVLISQEGDAGRLTGLYEVLQILDIMPPEGDRRLARDGFVMNGVGDGMHSFATATLLDGEIKGFVLVWPENDEQRRARVLDVMQTSFVRLNGTLDPRLAPPNEDQAIDMISGLSVRQPQLSRSGFYVSNEGIVVTTPEVTGNCQRITLDRDTLAEVVVSDTDLGVSILRPLAPLVPIDVATFQSDTPRLKDRIAVAGYPFNGVLSAPTLTYGTLEDIRSLDGNDQVKRLSVLSQPSNAGGPVMDDAGTVLGMILPRTGSDVQTLPADVHFSLDAQMIVDLLEAQGIVLEKSPAASEITPVALSREAADVTVLVSCW